MLLPTSALHCSAHSLPASSICCVSVGSGSKKQNTNKIKMEEENSEMAMKRQIEFLWGNLTASVERNADISSEIDK